MAMVFVALIQDYSDLGLGPALIQRKDSKLQSIHWNSIFWCNVAMNWIGFAIISIGFSRLVAIYYGEEILYYLVIGLSLKLIWSPFIFIHRIKLNKAMNFKRVFIIQASGVIVGGIVGVVMAYSGFGVWSLVGQSLSGSLVNLPVAWFLVSWKPSFDFNFKAIKGLLSFGIFELMARMITFFHKNANVLILGGLFNSAFVGYFVFAKFYLSHLW